MKKKKKKYHCKTSLPRGAGDEITIQAASRVGGVASLNPRSIHTRVDHGNPKSLSSFRTREILSFVSGNHFLGSPNFKSSAK